MKRLFVILAILILGVGLCSCGSYSYRSDFFEKASIKDYLSERSRLSGDSVSVLYRKHDKRNDVLPIWKVDKVEMEFRYDRSNDRVDIVSASFYAHYSTKEEEVFLGDELDTKTVDEIDVEWWPLSGGSIWIDDVFFYGENGIYGFHIGEKIPE